jgi:hypothetical protein
MAGDKLEMLKTRVSSQVACTCDTDRLPRTKTGPQQLFCCKSLKSLSRGDARLRESYLIAIVSGTLWVFLGLKISQFQTRPELVSDIVSIWFLDGTRLITVGSCFGRQHVLDTT